VSDGIGDDVADGKGVAVVVAVDVAVGGTGVGEGGSGVAVIVAVAVAVAVGGGVGEASQAIWVALHPRGMININRSKNRRRKVLIVNINNIRWGKIR
jgi:hypothetical protein